MRRVTDDCLVEIANLNRDTAFGISKGTKITDMTIPANLDWRTIWHIARAGLEPFVEFDGATANIGVRRACHL